MNRDAQFEACRTYAVMMNALDCSRLEPRLVDDVTHYLEGKQDIDRETGPGIWVEIAHADVLGARPCVV